MSDFEAVGTQFVQHYYNTFDVDKNNLAGLYSDQSMLTFDTEQFLGAQSIIEKLAQLPPLKHTVTSSQYQPTINNGIICFISGTINIDGDANPIAFAQVFHLQVGGTQGYYVHNDMFRMNIG